MQKWKIMLYGEGVFAGLPRPALFAILVQASQTVVRYLITNNQLCNVVEPKPGVYGLVNWILLYVLQTSIIFVEPFSHVSCTMFGATKGIGVH